MSESALSELISKIADSSVMVVGDIMLDRFVYGAVERISPESPVPVLAVSREDKMLGGAGNAISNLRGLGANATMIGVIGNDDDGAQVKELLDEQGVNSASLIVEDNRPTITKTRFLAGHQQLLRTDYENKTTITDKTMNAVLGAVKSGIDKVGAIILSDYGKGMLRPDLITQIIDLAQSKNIPVIVDPKGTDFSIYKGASAVTPNKKELTEATQNHPVDTDENVTKAAQTLIEDCGIEAVIATRSGEGISVIENGQDPVHLGGADIEVFDVSGAGDTVIATIAAAIAAGASLPDAAALANIAGSIVVTKVGTAPIRADELSDMLESDQGDIMTRIGENNDKADRTRKGDVLDWDEAAEQVARWKARGLKVGFTNGCFDILHFGHVSYLNNARDHCDRLIVGLNHDASVSILKGPERPIHDENSRAHVLAALGSTDMVVLFGATEQGGDNTAIDLLNTLKPDIYFKGGDYTEDQIPEAPTVRAYGGDVNVMPVYDGHSTTSSIEKSRAKAS